MCLYHFSNLEAFNLRVHGRQILPAFMFSLVCNIYVDDTNIISELLIQMDCITYFILILMFIIFIIL